MKAELKPIYLFLLLAVAIAASAVVFTPPDGGVVTPPPDPTGGHATGIPTVTTNVSYWNFPGMLTGKPNTGGSQVGADAVLTLRPHSTDLAGVIDFYVGSVASTGFTNLFTLQFSKPFATPPYVCMSSITTNNTAGTPAFIRDVTTTNVLFCNTTPTQPGNRYVITYQVMP